MYVTHHWRLDNLFRTTRRGFCLATRLEFGHSEAHKSVVVHQATESGLQHTLCHSFQTERSTLYLDD
jgi:hypothetical protein